MTDEQIGRLVWWFLLSLPLWGVAWGLERAAWAVAGLLSLLADWPGREGRRR